jgi:FtsZ-binding cell division protein ZapB
MLSLKPDKKRTAKTSMNGEPRNFNQLGLDFMPAYPYSVTLRKESEPMNIELFELLEQKIGEIVEKYALVKEENSRLIEENRQLSVEREAFKSRIDAILGKLDGI